MAIADPEDLILVLLPGLGGTGELFAPFLAELNPSQKTLVISYPPNHSLSYPALISFVRAELPERRPFAILAESFSGPIAISIASNPPANMRKLILCCSFAEFPDGALRWLGRHLAGLPVAGVPPISAMNVILMGKWRTPALAKALKQSLARVDPNVLKDRALAALSINAKEAMSAISLPTLYLAAAQDRLISRKARDAIVLANPSAKVTVLQGPHFLLQCRPAAAATEVSQFLAENGDT